MTNQTRCNLCDACKRVEEVRRQGLRALAAKPGNGEDVRLIWNRTLEENPCTGNSPSTVPPHTSLDDYPPTGDGNFGGADLPPSRKFNRW